MLSNLMAVLMAVRIGFWGIFMRVDAKEKSIILFRMNSYAT
jgi:hypothetical protein